MKELEIINTVNDIINILPLIFQYVVPGYFGMLFYSFVTTKKFTEKIYIFGSCIASFVLLSLVQFLRHIIPLNIIPNTLFLNVFASTILGLLIVGIICYLFTQKWFQNFFVLLFGKSILENVLDYAVDFENGSNIKAYLKNKDYYVMGHLAFFEEKDDDSWIVISAFSKRGVTTNLLCTNEPDNTNDNNAKLVIRLKDIEHMEIF